MRRCFLPLLALLAAAPPVPAEPVVRYVEFHDVVQRVSAEWLIQAIDAADREGDALVLVRLDTPGGSVSSLEDIVKRMFAAKTPVVVWVGPSGAQAASAGFIILIAADVCAMAPGTRSGAASPVGLGGGDVGNDTMKKKVFNDIAALARTIAQHRDRDVELCENAVWSATAYTDTELLEKGIIQFVAKDRDELLKKLDGAEVRRFDGTKTTLHTTGARVVDAKMDTRQEWLSVLADPTLAYFLLMVGLGALYIEFNHPGLIYPAVVGVLCLLLFAFSSQVLPVSAIGVLLILAGIGMFALEMFIASYGLLSVGGIVCLVFGSLMLYDGPTPGLRLSIWTVVPSSLVMAGSCAFFVRLAVKARNAPVTTGVEGMRGEVGEVTEELAPQGRVFVHGETWNAVCPSATVPTGGRVRVLRVDGLTLTVEPADGPVTENVNR